MWAQGVLVLLLARVSELGGSQPTRCRVGGQLPLQGLEEPLAQPPAECCPCASLPWALLAATGAILAFGLLWAWHQRAPLPTAVSQDPGRSEATLLRDVTSLLRLIHAQLRQLESRPGRGDAPQLPTGPSQAPGTPAAASWGQKQWPHGLEPHSHLSPARVRKKERGRLPWRAPPSWPAEGARGRRHLALRTRPAAGRSGASHRCPSSAPPGASLAATGDDTAPAAGPPAPLPPPLPPAACPAPDLALSPAPARTQGILRRRGPGGQARRRQVRFLLGPGPAEAPPGLGAPGRLAAPEPHTSLALAEEARAAARQGFDARRAARERLATSFRARCSLEGKAAAGTNIPREQPLYQGLVSLRVPAEEVLSSALQEKLALVPVPVPSPPEPPREPEPEPDGPELLMFCRPAQLFAQTPHLGVEGLPPLRLQPHSRPPAAAFLMFRKLQQWDA